MKFRRITHDLKIPPFFGMTLRMDYHQLNPGSPLRCPLAVIFSKHRPTPFSSLRCVQTQSEIGSDSRFCETISFARINSSVVRHGFGNA